MDKVSLISFSPEPTLDEALRRLVRLGLIRETPEGFTLATGSTTPGNAPQEDAQ